MGRVLGRLSTAIHLTLHIRGAVFQRQCCVFCNFSFNKYFSFDILVVLWQACVVVERRAREKEQPPGNNEKVIAL